MPVGRWASAKGVLFDYKTGNFFTLDSEGRVVRASHGTRAFMTPEQLEVAWPGRVWNHVDVLRQHTKHGAGQRLVFYLSTCLWVPPCCLLGEWRSVQGCVCVCL